MVVDIERAGVCGTDVEFFTGEMAYLQQGHAHYPMRLGHEWCGRVASVGPGVDGNWIGVRVTGDTMIGCGNCQRCRSGRHHVCAERIELGIRGGWPGALAEQMAVPASALRNSPVPSTPLRGRWSNPAAAPFVPSKAAVSARGERLLVVGPGTIGLLAALFAGRAGSRSTCSASRHRRSTSRARSAVDGAWTESDLPDLPFDAIIDATNSASIPARALDLVEPGRRVVYVGLAGTPSNIDTRTLALKDVTAVGILGGSAGLAWRDCRLRVGTCRSTAAGRCHGVARRDRCSSRRSVTVTPRPRPRRSKSTRVRSTPRRGIGRSELRSSAALRGVVEAVHVTALL